VDEQVRKSRLLGDQRLTEGPKRVWGVRRHAVDERLQGLEANPPVSLRQHTGGGQVRVTKDPFAIRVDPEARLYKPVDKVSVNVKAEGPNGDPVRFAGKIEVFRVEYETAKNEKGETYQKEKATPSTDAASQEEEDAQKDTE
jgi:hypothetical protein